MDGFIELRQIVALLLRRWWILIIGAVLGAGLGLAVSRAQAPLYEATMTLIVGSITNSNQQWSDIQLSERLVLTYADLVRRQPVLQGAVDALQLNDTWQALGSRVSARPVENTQLLEISVKASSPREAQMLADEVGRQLARVSSTTTQSKPSDQVSDSEETRQFVNQRLKNLQNNLETGQRRLSALEEQLARVSESSLEQVADVQAKIKTLSGVMSDWERTYALLLSSSGKEQPANYLDVFESAEANPDPVQPRVRLNTLVGMLVGFCLAVGLVLFSGHLDDSIKAAEDVSHSLGLSTLGVIHHVKGNAIRRKLFSSPAVSPASEDYRLLRSKLQFIWSDWPHKVVMVTSPGPSEQKSFLVANLGIVLAQAGLNTMIVDADLRQRMQHKIFQLPNDQGLAELLLLPTADVCDHLQTTFVTNLRVLTAGELMAFPSECLGSARMSHILDQLANVADVVICDGAQAVSIADGLVLSRQVNGVVLLIESGNTRRPAAEQAVQNLKDAGANLLGAVLSSPDSALVIPKPKTQKTPPIDDTSG